MKISCVAKRFFVRSCVVSGWNGESSCSSLIAGCGFHLLTGIVPSPGFLLIFLSLPKALAATLVDSPYPWRMHTQLEAASSLLACQCGKLGCQCLLYLSGKGHCSDA
eukprot:6476184-Amphidinium_carterae.2